MDRMPGATPGEYDDDALDSYSRTVMRVAEMVTPYVAAIEMTSARRNGRFRVGAGSAVLFTRDGYLLTNSHVVAGTDKGHAAFADGSRTDLELVGDEFAPGGSRRAASVDGGASGLFTHE